MRLAGLNIDVRLNTSSEEATAAEKAPISTSQKTATGAASQKSSANTRQDAAAGARDRRKGRRVNNRRVHNWRGNSGRVHHRRSDSGRVDHWRGDSGRVDNRRGDSGRSDSRDWWGRWDVDGRNRGNVTANAPEETAEVQKTAATVRASSEQAVDGVGNTAENAAGTTCPNTTRAGKTAAANAAAEKAAQVQETPAGRSSGGASNHIAHVGKAAKETAGLGAPEQTEIEAEEIAGLDASRSGASRGDGSGDGRGVDLESKKDDDLDEGSRAELHLESGCFDLLEGFEKNGLEGFEGLDP